MFRVTTTEKELRNTEAFFMFLLAAYAAYMAVDSVKMILSMI